MKFKKLISSSLAIGLLFNTTLISFASVLSEDGRYETFEENNIAIDNILEEDKVDVEIEGNTMVNLVKMPSITKKTIEVITGWPTILADFTNKNNINWSDASHDFSSFFWPKNWPATTAPPVPNAINTWVINTIIVSTKDTADTAASPTLATIIESTKPTTIKSNCSTINGPINFLKSELENK